MRISKVVHTYIVNCPDNVIHFMTLIGFQFRTPYINSNGIQWIMHKSFLFEFTKEVFILFLSLQCPSSIYHRLNCIFDKTKGVYDQKKKFVH